MMNKHDRFYLPMRQIAPMGRGHRVSSESAWPLRNAKGQTFAEAKREREEQTHATH